MLKKEELLERVDEEYVEMLKQVNIADFTKCIAQFSGLNINEVSDASIKEYLQTWAKNKYRFFKRLGNKLRLDSNILYENLDSSASKLINIGRDYPVYSLWLEEFVDIKNNKINCSDLSWKMRQTIRDLFPHYELEGSKLTAFFKKCLNASDEVVTAIGRVYENDMIEANYTISIDPVDMMLASENPYDWNSCYRLETDNDCSHADGCLAAILDDSSLITYIWNNKGEYNLYDKFTFKSIRYKRIRQWISISPSENAIHFNVPYPGKFDYPAAFLKELRQKVENWLDEDALWKKNESYAYTCSREYGYGYGEFRSNLIYYKDGSPEEYWYVYNKEIVCPCGCGYYLYGADENDYNLYYNGYGFIYENFEEVEEDEYYDEEDYEEEEENDDFEEENTETATEE